jgi:gamma-glutamyl-gamma-aminobutyrate hydrolase PuuD
MEEDIDDVVYLIEKITICGLQNLSPYYYGPARTAQNEINQKNTFMTRN